MALRNRTGTLGLIQALRAQGRSRPKVDRAVWVLGTSVRWHRGVTPPLHGGGTAVGQETEDTV